MSVRSMMLAVVLSSLLAAQAGADGLLPNGGFEAEGDAVGASPSLWEVDAGRLTLSDERPFEGRRCLAIQHPNADVSTWTGHETVALPGEGLYVISIAYRNPDGATIFPQLNYYADEGGKRAKLQSWGQPFRGRQVQSGDEWHRIQRIIRIYPGTTHLRVALAVRGEPATAYIDDLYLARVDEARPGQIENLALFGEAGSWDENTGLVVLQQPPHPRGSSYWPWWDGLYSPSEINDGDDRTYWVSTAPTSDPPKDVGLQWPQPVTVATVIAKYPHREVCPDPGDVRLQLWDGEWHDATVDSLDFDLDAAVYVYRLEPVSTKGVRLYFDSFARRRCAVQELEVYAEPRAVEPAQVARNFHYEGPTEPGPAAGERPKLLMWYDTKRGTTSAEPWLREYSTGLDDEGNPVPVERLRAHMRRRMAMEREAGVDGIMLKLGANRLSAEAMREPMEVGYGPTGISGREHLQTAIELGMDRSMPLLYFATILNDTWERVAGLAKTVQLENGRTWLDWRDDASWALVEETVREMARQAAIAGCPGVAFDIEPYTVGMDVYYAERYTGVDAQELLEVAERRGRELAGAIVAEFEREAPGVEPEIIWLAGYARDDLTLHNALFRGLTSVRHGGLHIATEAVYTSAHPEHIRRTYESAWEFGLAHAGDTELWRERCGVAHGSWPLYRGADRCLAPDEVRAQLREFAAQEPAPKYMWWYTGSWLCIEDPEWTGYRQAYGPG